MRILIRQHIGSDVAMVSKYMDDSNIYHPYKMKLLCSDIYSLEFQFLFENEKDKKDYWLKIWRLQKNINRIGSFINNILEKS